MLMKKFFYRVEKGDRILNISQKFNIPFCKIILQNGLIREVSEGDLLYLEQDETNTVYTVKPTDTLEKISERFCVKKEEIIEKNGTDFVFYGLKIYL